MAPARPEGCVVTFGAITDTQYCDIDDAHNFAKTALRQYRNSLKMTLLAARAFQEAEVEFIVQLGDIIDGKCAGDKGGQGRTSEEALETVMSALKACTTSSRIINLLGNHELYNFPRADLSRLLSTPAYGCFRPAEGVAVLWLDPYDVSTIQPAAPHSADDAYDLLEKRNPNNLREACNWTDGLSGADRRFVPYNGAIGEQQIAWLCSELDRAEGSGEKVLVLCHVPLKAESASEDCVLWNADEVLAVIRARTCVAAVFSGHCHEGGYHFDESGLHHVTLVSPLENVGEEGAHAVVHVCGDRLEVQGGGKQKSMVLRYRG